MACYKLVGLIMSTGEGDGLWVGVLSCLLPPILRWSLLIVSLQIINFVPARREKWGPEPGLSSPRPHCSLTKEGGDGVCVCEGSS